jgi:hypothetical protein
LGLGALGSLSSVPAQSINVTSTGVGIGTANPAGKAEIFGSGLNLFLNQPSAADIYLRYHVPDVRWWTVGAKANGDFWFSNSSTLTTDDNTPLVIKSGGNVGIGITTPAAPLHVAAPGYFTLMSTGTGLGTSGLIALRNVNTITGWNLGIESGAGWAGGPAGTLYIDKDSYGPRFAITPDGNVGVGTVNPSHKLTVNGEVKSRGFITDTSNWSDYVFEPDYELPSLAEVESRIIASKHLPGVPSEAELIEKGLDLGEMAKVQMAQIEQLMLHVIALNKQVQAQSEEIKQLKADIKR